MKKVSSLLIAFCITISIQGQKIRGTVKDTNTGALIENATIFFSGTSSGVYSGKDGSFAIDISQFSGMPLSVSALGYYSSSIQKPDPENHYTVLLSPKTYELNEVVVQAKGRAYKAHWRRDMEQFKKQFLGESLNAMNCEILNETDIYFAKKDETLVAYAFKPVIIENARLGYKVTYFLDRFEYTPKTYSLLIRGEIIFEDKLKAYKSNQAKRIEQRRETSYLGSRMHFFRSLWENKLDSSGFEIKNEQNEKLGYDTLVVEDKKSKVTTLNKFMHYPADLKIAFFTKDPESTLKLNAEYVYFEKCGYFEPLDVAWGGKMSRQRIGDLLPFDYEFEKSKK
ncbi:MAG TPA: carboxypeptidase-like regulatory domain-containing protein [Bacteroidales bacterium]|nr:carboxypeptidase-like regulatory domain-containing protein [Bacteroidales bacterium]